MVTIQRFDIKQYYDSIKDLENRRALIYDQLQKSKFDSALADRLIVIDQELSDLYAIVYHFSAPGPHSLNFYG